jgi:hypothetical protein
MLKHVTQFTLFAIGLGLLVATLYVASMASAECVASGPPDEVVRAIHVIDQGSVVGLTGG